MLRPVVIPTELQANWDASRLVHLPHLLTKEPVLYYLHPEQGHLFQLTIVTPNDHDQSSFWGNQVVSGELYLVSHLQSVS
jgi:hypothetical protein